MAIDIKADAEGVDININGEVGDVFAEALFTTQYVAQSFKESSDLVSKAFYDYIKFVMDMVMKDDEEEQFDFQTFFSEVLRLIRTHPSEAERLYTEFLEGGGVDTAHTLVLLSMQSRYAKKENPEKDEE